MSYKICSTCNTSKDTNMFGVRKSSTDGLRGQCKKCKNIKTAELRDKDRGTLNANERARYHANIDKQRERSKAYRASNKAKCLSNGARYRKVNKEKINAKERARYADNKEATADRKRLDRILNPDKYRERARKYRKANRDKLNEAWARRHANKLKATPAWTDAWDTKYFKEIYKLAFWLNSLEGTQYHVDHIIPLQGDTVCGFHTPSNLQILSAKDNLIKGNKLCL